jgi:hypothetical protein
MIHYLYQGGDAGRYDRAGREIATSLGLGNYSVLDEWRIGTTALEFLVGFLYTTLPRSREGMFLLFSLFAFLGSLFFLLAFRVAFPHKRPEAYAAIVLFLPSILFWPASLGKDAVTFFGFGLVAYGAALQWVRHAPQGFLWVVAGLAPVVLVRPHSAGIFLAAAGVSFFWSAWVGRRRIGMRLASGVLLGIVGYFVMQANAGFLFGADMDVVTTTDVVELYESRKQSTLTGGSAVEIPTETLLLAPVYVPVTVLFRPFPWEAGSPAMAVTALESVFFLWFFVKYRKTLWANLKLTPTNMLLSLCLFFSLALMAFQSGTSNLGIIARQRVQFLPYLFMLFL